MTEAKVQNVAVLDDFRAALLAFEQEARGALCAVDLEVGRAVDWLVNDQMTRWQHEVRKCGEAVVQAKADLHRCRSMPTPGGGEPSCHDQMIALERVKQRLQEAEEKVRATRQWATVVQREVGEYQGRANQLVAVLDADVPRAAAALEQMAATLESYLAIPSATGSGKPPAT